MTGDVIHTEESVIKFEGGTKTALTLLIPSMLLLPVILLLTAGDIFAGAAFLVSLLVIVLTVYRVDWGFLLFIGFVLFFDEFDIPGFKPITIKFTYFATINLIVPNLPESIGVVTPMEVHLLFLVCMVVVTAVAMRGERFVPVKGGWVFGVFFAWIVGALVYGTVHGGETRIGLWEIRALGYFVILPFLTSQVIRTRKQLEMLVWILIVVVTFKALQGVERFVSLGFSRGYFRALTSHEDAIFEVTIFMLWLGLIVIGGHPRQRRILTLLLLPLVFGLYVANRRAAYVSLAICTCVLMILYPRHQRNRILIPLAVFSVLFLIYLGIFWNRYGRLGAAAQEFKAVVFFQDRDMISQEDYSSSLARQQENYNLAMTLRGAPVLGIGFGRQHEWAIHNYGAFALKGYITHNEILWILVKTGTIGFFIFLFLIDLTVVNGSITFVRLSDPYLKSVCAVCVVAILNQVVASYVDMQLTYYRNMVYLGVLIGLISTLEGIESRELHGSDVVGTRQSETGTEPFVRVPGPAAT